MKARVASVDALAKPLFLGVAALLLLLFSRSALLFAAAVVLAVTSRPIIRFSKKQLGL
jgi:hypothetical protein